MERKGECSVKVKKIIAMTLIAGVLMSCTPTSIFAEDESSEVSPVVETVAEEIIAETEQEYAEEQIAGLIEDNSDEADEAIDVIEPDLNEAAEEQDHRIEEEDLSESQPEDQNEELTQKIAEEDLQQATMEEESPEELSVEEKSTEPSLSYNKIKAVIFTDHKLNKKAETTDEILIEGLLPDGINATAFPVEVEVTGEQVLVAYNISLWLDENEYQPNPGEIVVRIQSEKLPESSDVGVYHVEDNGEPTLVTETVTEDGMASFDADHFSVYVIVSNENGEIVTPRVTFHFISPDYTENNGRYTAGPYLFANKQHDDASTPDDGQYFWTQIVKNGETLSQVPTPGDRHGQHFEGWYVVNCLSDTTSTLGNSGSYTYTWPNNPERQVFGNVMSISITGPTVTYGFADSDAAHTKTATADVNGNVDVYLAPLYVNYRFVDFYDYDVNLVARKLLVLDSNNEVTVCISDVSASNPTSRLYFMGWSTVSYASGDQDSDNYTNVFSIYEEGYKRDVYITLKETAHNVFDVYEGKSVSGTPKISGYSAGTGNVTLYAEFEPAHWLRFVSGETGWGSIYVPADFLIGSSPARKLPVTTRAGYKFAGWWSGYQTTSGTIVYVNALTDSDGIVLDNVTADLIMSEDDGATFQNTGSVADGKLVMSEDSTVYAKWTPLATATYKVVIWKQKISDAYDVQVKTYDFYSYDERSCTNTSTPVNPTTADRNYASSNPNGDFEGFRLGTYDSNVMVDPQGTTVVNVYYDRIPRTLTFQAQSGGSWRTVKTITALCGQNISSNFPIVGTNGVTYDNGERWSPYNSSTYNQVLVYIDIMPNEDVTFRLNTSSNSTKHIHYYIEPLDPNDATRTYNGKGFVEYKTVDANYGYFTEAEDYIDLTGFSKSNSYPPEAYSSWGTKQSSVWRNSSAVDVYCYYLRNTYTLAFDFNYPGGATFTDGVEYRNENDVSIDDSHTNVKYETPLADFEETWPSAAMEAFAPDHYTFDGWYTDASCTVPFDFSSEIMHDSNLMIYVKWYPVYYLVKIDPAGGTLAGPGASNQSTYFWLSYGATISQYDTHRDYIEVDMSDPEVAADAQANPDDYYYYRYVTFNGFEHAKGFGNNPAILYYVNPTDANARNREKDKEGIKPAYDRLAEYVSLADYHGAGDTFYQYLLSNMQENESFPSRSTADYWDSFYVDTTHVYRLAADEDVSYTFVGWYKDGAPYNFASKVTTPVTLTARWRQSGAYRLHYSAVMTEMVNGTQVAGVLTGDEYDPGIEGEGYTDLAETHISTAPNNILGGGSGDGNVYVFEGWRAVNSKGQPIDENGNVIASGTGRLYQPGDTFQIRSAQAKSGVINMEAYYVDVTSSTRRPETINLTLDANTADGGSLVLSPESDWTWVKPGTIQADTPNNKILFGDIQTNVDVHLDKYKDSFSHVAGYALVGFDESSDAEGIRYLPAYDADAVIGVDGNPDKANYLYAIWELMVYVTFVNNTSEPINVDLSGTDASALFIVNKVTGTYSREPIDGTVMTIPANGQVRIVLPKGSGKLYNAAITGISGYEVTVTNTPVNASTANPATVKIRGANTENVSGELEIDETGAIITISDLKQLVTFNTNGGTWNIDNGTDYTGSGQEWYTATMPGSAVAEPYHNPTRAGFVFQGWSLTQDTTYTLSPAVIENMLYDFDTPITGPTTLYAVWKVIEVGSGTVKIMKEVAGMGDLTEPFTFTVTMAGRYRQSRWGSASSMSGSGLSRSVTMKSGQYLTVSDISVSTGGSGSYASLTAALNVYNADDSLAETYTLQWRASSTGSYNTVTFSSVQIVEEVSSRYDTILTETQDAGNDISESGRTVSYTDTGATGSVVYTNTRKTTVLTVTKALTDSLNPNGTFSFNVSVSDNGRQINMGADAEFVLGNGDAKKLTVPTGARVVITENVDSQVYDTSATVTNGSDTDSTANTVTLTASNTESTNSQQTVTFHNTRKTVEVRVTKELFASDMTSAFNFRATVKYEGNILTSYRSNGFASGIKVFSLRDNYTYGDVATLLVPYGTTLLITETVDESVYETTATGTATGSGAPVGNYSNKTYELDPVEGETDVLFSNMQAIVNPAPTEFRSNQEKSPAFAFIFGIAALAALVIYIINSKTKKYGRKDISL